MPRRGADRPSYEKYLSGGPETLNIGLPPDVSVIIRSYAKRYHMSPEAVVATSLHWLLMTGDLHSVMAVAKTVQRLSGPGAPSPCEVEVMACEDFSAVPMGVAKPPDHPYSDECGGMCCQRRKGNT